MNVHQFKIILIIVIMQNLLITNGFVKNVLVDIILIQIIIHVLNLFKDVYYMLITKVF